MLFHVQSIQSCMYIVNTTCYEARPLERASIGAPFLPTLRNIQHGLYVHFVYISDISAVFSKRCNTIAPGLTKIMGPTNNFLCTKESHTIFTLVETLKAHECFASIIK